MFRTILHVCCAALFALAAVPAQSAAEIAKFATDSKKLIELNDEKGLDKLIKSSPTMASAVVSHFMNLLLEQKGGKQALAATTGDVADEAAIVRVRSLCAQGMVQGSVAQFWAAVVLLRAADLPSVQAAHDLASVAMAGHPLRGV